MENKYLFNKSNEIIFKLSAHDTDEGLFQKKGKSKYYNQIQLFSKLNFLEFIMLQKYCKNRIHSEGSSAKNKYSPIWAALFYYSYPAKLQEIVTKQYLDQNNSQFTSLDRLNKIAQSQFTNARKSYPNKIFKYPEMKKYLKFIENQEEQKAYDVLIPLCNRLEQKYGEKSIILLYLRYFILRDCSTVIEGQNIILGLLQIIKILEKYNEDTNFLIADCYESLAEYNLIQNNIEESSKYIKKYSSILHKLVRSPSLELLKLYHLKSLSYNLQGMKQEGVNSAYKAINQIKETKDFLDKDTIRYIQQNLKYLIQTQAKEGYLNQAKISIDSLQQALIANKVKNPVLNLTLGNMRINLLEREGKIDVATEEQKQIIEEFYQNRKEESTQDLVDSYLNLGNLQLSVPNPDFSTAFQSFDKSVSLGRKHYGDDYLTTMNAQYFRIICLLKLEKIDEGMQSLKELYHLSKNYSEELELVQWISTLYIRCIEKYSGDYEGEVQNQ